MPSCIINSPSSVTIGSPASVIMIVSKSSYVIVKDLVLTVVQVRPPLMVHSHIVAGPDEAKVILISLPKSTVATTALTTLEQVCGTVYVLVEVLPSSLVLTT